MKIKRNTRIQILRNKVYGDDSKKDRPLSIRVSFAGNSVSVPVSMSVSLDLRGVTHSGLIKNKKAFPLNFQAGTTPEA